MTHVELRDGIWRCFCRTQSFPTKRREAAVSLRETFGIETRSLLAKDTSAFFSRASASNNLREHRLWILAPLCRTLQHGYADSLGQYEVFRLCSHHADNSGAVFRDSLKRNLEDNYQPFYPAMVQTAANLTLEECGDALYQMVLKAEQLFAYPVTVQTEPAKTKVCEFVLASQCTQDGHRGHSLLKAWRFPVESPAPR